MMQKMLFGSKRYKYVFFDLDHTLWDFDKNSDDALVELYKKYNLAQHKLFCENLFKNSFRKINLELWSKSDSGKLSKEDLRKTRFELVLSELGLPVNQIPIEIGEDYIQLCPQKNALIPFAVDVLNYLSNRYQMCILTNGFEDVQHIKLKNAGIDQFFTHVFTSESTNARKPDKEFFQHVLSTVGAKASECIMIGDNLNTDILGAQNSAIDHVYFNPNKRSYFLSVMHEITCLSELKKVL